MIVTCEKCGKTYDDYHRWTICPHNHLEYPPYDTIESSRPPAPEAVYVQEPGYGCCLTIIGVGIMFALLCLL